MSNLWLPGVAAPVGEFVDRLHRTIKEVSGQPYVRVELVDGSQLAIESISAEPGLGFVTLRPHPVGERPDAVVVPLGSIRRIEVDSRGPPEMPFGFGFSLPSA